MKKGITLAELLAVIVIIGVVSVGLITAYRQVFTQSIFTASTAKDEQSAQIFIDQIIRDLHSIGFGMWNNPGQPGSIHKIGNIGCNDLQSFASTDQGFIAIAKNCLNDNTFRRNGDRLYFFSLTLRDFTNSGCWGVVEADTCFRLNSTNYLGGQCEPGIFNNSNKIIALTPNKHRVSNISCLSSPNCPSGVSCQNAPPGAMVFFKDNHSYPSNFSAVYFIAREGENTRPRTCAPNTFTLYKQVFPENPQPVFSCIAAFKVRYVLNNNGVLSYADSVSNTSAPNLVGIRLCIMIQIGTQASLEQDVPSFSQNCLNDDGSSIQIHNEWRRYKWKVVEVDIPVKNR